MTAAKLCPREVWIDSRDPQEWDVFDSEEPGSHRYVLADDAAPAPAAEPPPHKQGCEALGGYGHGIGPCTCGAAEPPLGRDPMRELAAAGYRVRPAEPPPDVAGLIARLQGYGQRAPSPGGRGLALEAAAALESLARERDEALHENRRLAERLAAARGEGGGMKPTVRKTRKPLPGECGKLFATCRSGPEKGLKFYCVLKEGHTGKCSVALSAEPPQDVDAIAKKLIERGNGWNYWINDGKERGVTAAIAHMKYNRALDLKAAAALESIARERDEAVQRMEHGWIQVCDTGIKVFKEEADEQRQRAEQAERERDEAQQDAAHKLNKDLVAMNHELQIELSAARAAHPCKACLWEPGWQDEGEPCDSCDGTGIDGLSAARGAGK